MHEAAEIDLARLEGMSILLAEDNVTNQLVATQMLESLGAEVDIASDGAIAIERLKARTYDVLLIDIEMPRVSGLDVIRAIRADKGPLAQATVIALTAYAMQEHREKISGVGADGLIAKPITSIKQFGADILGYLDARCAAAGAVREDDGAQDALVERSIYDSLSASLGPEAMESILTRLETDLIVQRAEIDEAREEPDLESMASASHILISVGGMIGAVRLQGQAERLNRMSREEDTDGLGALAAATLREIDGVLAFVRTERETA